MNGENMDEFVVAFATSLAKWRELRDEDELAPMLERQGIDARILEDILAEVGATDARPAEAFAIGFLNGLNLGRDTMAEVAASLIATEPTEPTGPRGRGPGRVRPGLRRIR